MGCFAVTNTLCMTVMHPTYFYIIYSLLYKIRPYPMCKDYDECTYQTTYIRIAIFSHTCNEISVDGILGSQQERRSKEIDDPAEYDHARVAATSGLQKSAGCRTAGQDSATHSSHLALVSRPPKARMYSPERCKAVQDADARPHLLDVRYLRDARDLHR